MAEKWLPGLLGSALGEVQGRKWLPPGSPKEPPEEPKSRQNRIKIEALLPSAPGRFQDLSPGRPGDHFKTIFNDFGVDF